MWLEDESGKNRASGWLGIVRAETFRCFVKDHYRKRRTQSPTPSTSGSGRKESQSVFDWMFLTDCQIDTEIDMIIDF